MKFIEFFGGHIGDLTANPPVYPTVDSVGEMTLIRAKSIAASITGDGGSGCSCLRQVRATDGSITGSITARALGEEMDATSGLYITDGRPDADVTINGNVWGDISITGSVPGGIAVPAGRSVIIKAGIRSTAPVTIGGQLKGQVIINSQNSSSMLWDGATAINSQTLSPNSNFEITQSSTDLGGGAIGMAPFRLWKNDCYPVWKDNDTITGGDGLFETEFVPSGSKPVKIRFYGPIKRGASYATWNDAFNVQCRPLAQTGAARCN